MQVSELTFKKKCVMYFVFFFVKMSLDRLIGNPVTANKINQQQGVSASGGKTSFLQKSASSSGKMMSSSDFNRLVMEVVPGINSNHSWTPMSFNEEDTYFNEAKGI